ncbi:unnamed protein product [marine sediment metagenome]|uniref:Uncharacterized protein n=1 Tax=marine sediment metagenome TaxID=412755 RepID=X0Y2H5_9ZZZZ
MSKKVELTLADILLKIYTIEELKAKGLAEKAVADAVRLTQKGIELALEMRGEMNKPSIPERIFRFFFPKDFKGELKRGMEIGKGSAVAKKIGGGLYDVGKAARGKVDPEHKLKIGSQKEKHGK